MAPPPLPPPPPPPQPDASDSPPFIADRPTLSEDEYRQIIVFCGIERVSLRAVAISFRRLWSDPATWAGAAIDASVLVPSTPESTHGIQFLCRFVLPALTQAAAVDTHALALSVCGRRDKTEHALLSQSRFELLPA
eukprot:2320789-Prymnesium_polylepis.1